MPRKKHSVILSNHIKRRWYMSNKIELTISIPDYDPHIPAELRRAHFDIIDAAMNAALERLGLFDEAREYFDEMLQENDNYIARNLERLYPDEDEEKYNPFDYPDSTPVERINYKAALDWERQELEADSEAYRGK